MDKNYTISVIIPVFNVEDYIQECLASVARQTMTKDIECILVDDCGNDDSILLAKEFIKKYKGDIDFKIIHHKYNKGLSAARNTGLKNSIGEYVLFVDSDDKIYENCLEELYAVAIKYPKADFVQGSTYPQFLLSQKYYPEYSTNILWIRKNMCISHIPDPAWNRLVKRTFLINNNLFFWEGYIQEDTIWTYQLQHYVSAVAFCFKPTYWYRYNPQGIMHGGGTKREVDSFARAFNSVLKDMDTFKRIEPYEILYLDYVAQKVIGKMGLDKGKLLLITNENKLFNRLLFCRYIRNKILVYSSKNIFKKVYYKIARMLYRILVNPFVDYYCRELSLNRKIFINVEFKQ